jgi:hypothetical protein
MKTYIGVKIINAQPRPRISDGHAGYEVYYPDGYASWSPKETFEKAYREIEPWMPQTNEAFQKLAPHQKRVVEEESELAKKIAALDSFIHSSVYSKLPQLEKERLFRQWEVMREYSYLLQERVKGFVFP